ncbi:MAG: CoA-binding protein [Bacteroidota bacterium]
MPVEDDITLKKILSGVRTVAVVGASPNPDRDSNRITRYLVGRGYTVYPVNPNSAEVLGIPSSPDLRSLPGPVDLVNVFRRPEVVDEVVREAIAVGAKVLWLQLGVINEHAAATAEEHGLQVVMDRCIAVDHSRLM